MMQAAKQVTKRTPVTIQCHGCNELPTLSDMTSILSSAGHVRLRGLNFNSGAEFESAYGYLIGKPMNYFGGSGMRNNLSQNVLNVGFEPPFLDLPQHNELSYSDQWPQTFMLGCIENNLDNHHEGITTICDNKKLTENLPHELYDKFMDLGLKHIRNEVDKYNPNIPTHKKREYQSWQDSFLTDSKQNVEEECIKNGYKFEWDMDGTLYYEYVRPSFIAHPINGDILLFGNFLAGVDWYENWEPFCNYPGRDRPYWNQWGDGTEFTIEEKKIMRDLYQEFLMGDKWMNGDVLLLDNHYTTHGRTPYDVNGVREIAVMMGNRVVRSNFEPNGIGLCHFQD